MDNSDLLVLRQVQQWRQQGHCVVLGTVTRTWGSAPRPIGSLVALRDDGRVVGSVSGGCIEDDLIHKVQNGTLPMLQPHRLRYGVSADEATRFGLPCGGTLELVLEPVETHSMIEALLARLDKGHRVRRTLELGTGVVSLDFDPACDAEELYLDDHRLVSMHGPSWRLVLIGAGQLTQYLAEMAVALGYEVVICDPRAEYADSWHVSKTRLLRGMPDDLLRDLRIDGHTAVVALTHDPKLDDLALLEALTSPAFYVGAIGSRMNQSKRRQRLKEHFELTDAQLDRLHGPVGLRNGARTPPEIAVSILAELTAVRYGWQLPPPIPPQRSPTVEAGCATVP